MLRLNEHYTSVQGEGPRTGVLTQFVRFAGCNLRCPGWPCDTPHAIDPQIWKDEHEKLNHVDLMNRVHDEMISTGARNICLTGGEPLIQPATELWNFINLLIHTNRGESFTVELFTNGTRSFPAWVHSLNYDASCIMMDWKLQGSGEGKESLGVRRLNALRLAKKDGIKFVVKDTRDLLEAIDATNELRAAGCKATFWVGAVWEAMQPAELVEFIIANGMPWRLNVQLHKYIFDPSARRT